VGSEMRGGAVHLKSHHIILEQRYHLSCFN
jgi:hypothetical protein